MIKQAVDYAYLIDKYVRAEYINYGGESEGGSGYIVSIWDDKDGTVIFMFDYGMGFSIKTTDQKLWNFKIANKDKLEYGEEIEKIWGSQ
jgi:hypothetical protein